MARTARVSPTARVWDYLFSGWGERLAGLGLRPARVPDHRTRLAVTPLEDRVVPATDLLVNGSTSVYQVSPAVARDADGDYVVAWTSFGQDGSDGGVYARQFAADGTPRGAEFRVNTYTTGTQSDPAVAVDADGDFVVAWTSLLQDGSERGVYAQRYASDGSAGGAEFRVNTQTYLDQETPAVAMDADGDFVVAWQSWSQDGFLSGVYAQRYTSTGAAAGGEFRVNTHTSQSQLYPSVAMDADGDFVVSWTSALQDGDETGVYAQRYSAAGTAQGGEFQVHTYTTGEQASPAVAVDADGDFVISWHGEGTGDSSGVYAQRYSAAGVARGGEFRVNAYTTGSQAGPEVAVDADGDFVVVWSGEGSGDSGGVYARRYAADGTALGGEFRVNTYTTNGQYSAAAAVDSDGDLVVAWGGEGPGDADGVFVPGPDLPPAYVPEWAAGASSSLGGTAAGVGANNPAMTGAGLVRYADGTLALTQTDLWSDGYGIGWGQSRSWTNAAGYAPRNVNGRGWVDAQQPHLVRDPGGTTLAVVRDGTRADYYDLSGGVWTERFFGQDKLAHDAGNAEYVLTDTLGNVTRFHDFSAALPADQRGGLKSFADAAGNQVTVTYSAGGAVDEVTRSATVGGTAVTESLAYARVTSGGNTGLVASATLRRKVGAGAWATVRSVDYAYYDGTEAFGTRGDLKTAAVRDAAGSAIDTRYYRYYTAGEADGYEGGLKYVLEGDSYDRMTAALGTDLAGITDDELAPYADRYLRYDAARRVTLERVAGAGGGLFGLGEHTFAYHASGNSPGTNSWTTRTTETLPDGSTNTVYTNAYGQVMLAAFDDAGTTGQVWLSYYKYDAAGRTVLAAGPSGVTGYSEGNADLVGFSGGNAAYLSDSAGLFASYTYGPSTTATTSAAGDAAGYLQQVSVAQGESGTAVPQASLTYIKRTAGGADFFFVASDTAYRNDNGTGGQTTSYAYTWQGSTARPESATTTLPAVTAGQNGSATATTFTTVFDAYGRATWFKDQSGYLAYAEYDAATGAVTKTITDVNASLTSDFAGLPSGWTTPSGGGLHLIRYSEVDALGRVTKATSPEGRVDYTVYKDAAHEVRSYPGWDASTDTPTGPTVVTREDRAGWYSETLTMTATPAAVGGEPTGTESVSGLQSLSRSHTNESGQVTQADAYFDLTGLTYSTSAGLGTEGTHFYRTEYAYDARGRLARTEGPEGTISRTVYDGLGRAASAWVGTYDTPTSGDWSPANTAGTNLVKTAEYEYDGGGVGDSNLTKATGIPGGSAADRVTRTWFDWRNRPVAVKGGVEGSEATHVNRPLVYRDYDNLGQVTRTRTYDADGVTPTVTGGVPVAPSSGLLRVQVTAEYDDLGRVFRTRRYSVNPGSGAVSTNSLATDVWYDPRGLVLKQSNPNGLVEKFAYDGAGRVTKSFLGDWGSDAGYGDADDVTGDAVLEQSETTYDADGLPVAAVTRQRFHNASGTGALGSPSSGIGARVSYAGYFYDAGGRLTDAVDVGTNGGSAWTRPSTPPARSDTELVTSRTFDAAGRVFEVTDPKGLVSRTEYDALGRTTKVVENYVDGTVSDADDKTTTYGYNGVGMTSLTAHLTGGGMQTTEWVYGVTTSGGSGLNSNDVVGATRWPDPSTGAASGSEQETVAVNALGEVLTSTDRNGTTHALTRDALGRVVADAVTAFGTGVDQAVTKIETGYDAQGNVALVTSRNAANGVVNQVAREHNGLGQLTIDWQAHSGAVGGSTPKVQYAYNFNGSGTVNQSRPTSVTYPNTYVSTRNYSSGLNSAVSRVSSLSDSTGSIEAYDYLGAGNVVGRGHSQPGLDLTYAGTPADAGDQYAGLDRFGRVVDQKWVKGGAAVDEFRYGYDRGSNRLWRDNAVSAAFGELYAYDGLDQVSSFQRGTLNAPKTGLTGAASRSQSWDYDAAGNWESLTTDGTAQARTHDRQNEVTGVGAATPGFDDAGNMTQSETGLRYVYDAWNRLVAVKDSAGTTTLRTYAYDGLNRRVSETAGGTTTDLFYSADWQVLEERVGAVTSNIYVWSPAYVDALVMRVRDSNLDGSLDERLWATQDANWNVTALVNDSGVVVERYAYDPFGVRTVYDASYAVRSGGSNYDFQHGHQGLWFDVVAGLNFTHTRPYSPSLGRFTSPDWIRFDGGDVNLFRAVANNPIKYTDPTGTVLPFIIAGAVVLATPSGLSPGEQIENALAVGGAAGLARIALGVGGSTLRRMRCEPQPKPQVANPPLTIEIGPKIAAQMEKRGWTPELIKQTVNNPTRTVATRDTRHLPGGAGKLDDPATVYIGRRAYALCVESPWST